MRARLLGSWSRPLAGSLVGLALAAGACAADDPVDRSGSSPPGLDGDGASDEGSPGDPSEVGEAVSAEVTVLAEGLVNPVGLALLPDGGVLVAEEGTGEDDASAGVSLLTLDGRVGRVITGLPSSVDSGDLSGVPFVGVDPAGERVLLSFFGAERLLTLPLTGSPPVPGEPVGIDALDSAMTPLNNVRLTNPFDITFAGDGTPVVSDASQNGVATENPDGTTRFIHRFADLRDPADPALEIDPVPTGIERVGDEYYVTLTGGCPFPARSGRLVAIDGERGERTVADGLDMPIDVARGPDGTVWVLEFARFAPGSSCFTGEGYESGTGRLSRLDASGALEEVLDGLDFPGSVLPLADGTVLVTEVFAGRLLQVVPDGQSPLLAAVAEPVEASAAWQLVDVAADVGLDFVHGSFAESVSMDPVAAMGGGLCWIDHDGDDRLDLYLVNSHAESEEDLWNGRGGLPTNALYRNAGGRFVDVSVATGTDLAVRGNGCVAADFNLDGAIDIYVTADGPNSLLLNRGDGTFVERGGDAGVAAEEWSTAAVVGDVNRDGLPDLFVASYIDLALTIPHPSGAFPQDYVGLTDHLFLNQGVDADGLPRFVDVAADVGLTDPGRGLGALLSDFDRDGDLDLYVTNDGNPNRLYRNDPVGDGPGVRFVDVTGSAAVGDSGSGMGVAGGDFDGDSTFDLVVTNWDRELNAVYTNVTDDELSFQYMTFRLGISGLGNNQTGWGTAWADLDNDTDLDLFIANGHVPVTDLAADGELARLYLNRLSEDGAAGLRDHSGPVGLAELGAISARGSALADFDDDGDLDIAINVIGGSVVLLRNDDPPGASIVVDLGPRPGAVVEVELPDGGRMVRESHAGSSYLASEDPRLVIGIGDAPRASVVTVRWPDGSREMLTDVAAGSRLVLEPGG